MAYSYDMLINLRISYQIGICSGFVEQEWEEVVVHRIHTVDEHTG